MPMSVAANYAMKQYGVQDPKQLLQFNRRYIWWNGTTTDGNTTNKCAT